MQQPAGWLRHACICFALMSKSLPKRRGQTFIFRPLKISVSYSETLAVIWESLLDSLGLKCSRWVRDSAESCSKTLLFYPFFRFFVWFFFVKSSQCWSWVLYFVQRRARQSLWPSFMEFEWQSSHSVGTGGSRHHELTEHGRWLLSWSPSLSGLLSVMADLYLLNPHVFYS